MDISGLVPSTFPRVVALETSDCSFTLYQRPEEGPVKRTELPFSPFILLREVALLNGLNGKFDIVPFEGFGELSCMALFPGMGDFNAAKKHLKTATGFTPGSPNAPYLALTDTVQQALILNGIRLFSGMAFRDVRRMQIDIETLCEPNYDFSNADREHDAIVIIGIHDSTGWERVLSQKDMTEKEMLEELVHIVTERDPDILEGHNLFRFDLPYLEARAKRHKVKLTFGRDGSVPKKRSSRFNAAERTVNYTRYDIYGRHIVDTYHLAVFYDAATRDLDGYGLKDIARHFKVARTDRVYADAGNMDREWAENPDRACEYCLDDVRETCAIAEILAPASFYQTNIIPLSYQNCVIRGNATKIDSIFLAEYITKRRALPRGEPARPFAGALTQSFEEGVYDGILHCDVRSLYPSILLSEQRAPRNDTLGVFLHFLERLRAFRLEAKDAMKHAPDPADREYYRSLQSAFKILINSFYGYLGFAQGFLNDFDLAEHVTARGRGILTSMLNFLRDSGALVIEMDTDGIYFQPSANQDAADLKTRLNAMLPPGIEVEFDEKFKSMFSYKSKNYALLKENGELAISGAALKSRGLEPFQREYIKQMLICLLNRDGAGCRALDASFEDALRTHTFGLEELSKSETLSDSTENYKKKLADGSGRRSAAYELAIRSGREYRQGDQVFFYMTGTKRKAVVVDNAKLLSDSKDGVRDENVEYYLGKLEELRTKFAPFTDALINGAQPSLF